MRRHFNYFIFSLFTPPAEVLDVKIRLTVEANFLQVQRIKIDRVFLQITLELLFRFRFSDFFLINDFSQFAVKAFPQAMVSYHKDLDPQSHVSLVHFSVNIVD